MPSWLISILISLFTRWVWPTIIAWLHKKFPWLPAERLKVHFEEYKKNVDEGMSKKQAKSILKESLKHCYGIGCPPQIKEL